MAGAVPESTIQPAILEKMPMDDHAAVAGAFLQQTGATDTSSVPPFGTSAFSYFWSFVTRFQLEAKEKQASSGAKTHAGKSTGKLLERSTAEAAHAPTQSAAANVYSSKECIGALKKFVDTKRIGSVDAVLAQVPAAARAVLMAKSDADAATVLGADGQEAKRGALSIITKVLPQRVKNVIRSSPHSPDLNFPEREKLAKHATHALYSTHAAPWTFVRTKQGTKLKNGGDWRLYMQHEPDRWVNDTANAIELFANATTAARVRNTGNGASGYDCDGRRRQRQQQVAAHRANEHRRGHVPRQLEMATAVGSAIPRRSNNNQGQPSQVERIASHSETGVHHRQVEFHLEAAGRKLRSGHRRRTALRHAD